MTTTRKPSTVQRLDAIEVTLDRIIVALGLDSPAKPATKGKTARTTKARTAKPRQGTPRKGTTAKRVRTAPGVNGDPVFLSKHSRKAFLETLVSEMGVTTVGFDGMFFDEGDPIAHLSTKAAAEYAMHVGCPQGFKVGPGYNAVIENAWNTRNN